MHPLHSVKNVFLSLLHYAVDVDECQSETDNCSTNAHCINTAGSYTCKCKTGYSGNGVNCTGKGVLFLCDFLNAIYFHCVSNQIINQ